MGKENGYFRDHPVMFIVVFILLFLIYYYDDMLLAYSVNELT